MQAVEIEGMNQGNLRLDFISKHLLAWYDESKRVLPWRDEVSSYRTWISEIMLQQTRVEAVKPYFARFMDELPDVRALANVPEEHLLKLWEGLGYYSRARNLKRAACVICERYDGELPADYEALLSLPGIGPYTAGAIASIAYGICVPAVDGNVLRVLARVRRDERLMSDDRVRRAIESELLAVMPADRPGDFNQAMMELGAMICLPNGAPHCECCPLREACLAATDDTWSEYPRKADKKARRVEERTVLVIQDADLLALHKRPSKGLLAGLYEFPSLEGYPTEDEILSYLADRGLKAIQIHRLPDAKHIFTHREWHMRGYRIRVDELEQRIPSLDAADWIYVSPKEAGEHYPIPSAFSAYTACVEIPR